MRLTFVFFKIQPKVKVVEPQKATLDDNKNDASYSKPNDYLFFSLFNAFFCCCCVGIVAVIHSMRAREANRNPSSENEERASENSKKALKLNLIALALGACVFLFLAILYIILSYAYEGFKKVYG